MKIPPHTALGLKPAEKFVATCAAPHVRERFRVALATSAITLLAFALVGCSGPPSGTAAQDDGVRCGDAPGATAVFVELTYDASGMPVVVPANCELQRGTTLTWRGPAQNLTAFQVRFKTASASSALRGSFGSKDHGGRQAIVARADSPPGRYDYAVRANGKELDPAIIIH